MKAVRADVWQGSHREQHVQSNCVKASLESRCKRAVREHYGKTRAKELWEEIAEKHVHDREGGGGDLLYFLPQRHIELANPWG